MDATVRLLNLIGFRWRLLACSRCSACSVLLPLDRLVSSGSSFQSINLLGTGKLEMQYKASCILEFNELKTRYKYGLILPFRSFEVDNNRCNAGSIHIRPYNPRSGPPGKTSCRDLLKYPKCWAKQSHARVTSNTTAQSHRDLRPKGTNIAYARQAKQQQ